MCRLTISILLLAMTATGYNNVSATEPKIAAAAETKYLLFQVWPRMPGYPGIPPLPGQWRSARSRWRSLCRAWSRPSARPAMRGTNWVSPSGRSASTSPTRSTRQWIRDAFAVARENDVAVALHIDDSMSWGAAQGSACPIPTTSRRRTGNKSPTRPGAWPGGPSRRSFRRRCVTTPPPSWPRRKIARG